MYKQLFPEAEGIELSVKTLHFPLSTEFRRYCVLSGGTHQKKKIQEIKLFLVSFHRNRTHNLSRLQSNACAIVPTALQLASNIININILLQFPLFYHIQLRCAIQGEQAKLLGIPH